ncbi:MAG: hypothetical protein Q8T09_10785 [Candidatus Melainabacteria bacterium]|nr:hypothetical protein [Candidatus Melainabacteria bacterium]
MTNSRNTKERSVLEKSRSIVDLDGAIGQLDDAQFFLQSLLIGLSAALILSTLFFVPIALAFPLALVTGQSSSPADLHLISSWVVSSVICGSIAAAVLVCFLSFVHAWQVGQFGKPYERRSIQLPQNFHQACELVGFALAELDGYDILVADTQAGHLLLELQQTSSATNYLTVNLCTLTNGGTLVNVTAAPALTGRAKLFSAFYCDRGVNADNVDCLIAFLKPFARLEDLNLKPKVVKPKVGYDPRVRDRYAPPSSLGGQRLSY